MTIKALICFKKKTSQKTQSNLQIILREDYTGREELCTGGDRLATNVHNLVLPSTKRLVVINDQIAKII